MLLFWFCLHLWIVIVHVCCCWVVICRFLVVCKFICNILYLTWFYRMKCSTEDWWRTGLKVMMQLLWFHYICLLMLTEVQYIFLNSVWKHSELIIWSGCLETFRTYCAFRTIHLLSRIIQCLIFTLILHQTISTLHPLCWIWLLSIWEIAKGIFMETPLLLYIYILKLCNQSLIFTHMHVLIQFSPAKSICYLISLTCTLHLITTRHDFRNQIYIAMHNYN
jgi:hypothetical protein